MEPTTEFRSKDEQVQRLIIEAIDVLSILGIPFNGLTWRRIERIAMAFLATGQVNTANGWENIKDLNDGVNMKTRDIIQYNNEFFEENISPGSYDDIRRKDLILLVTGEVVLRTNENLARNDSTRGYAINPAITASLRSVGKEGWKDRLQEATSRITTATEKLKTTRQIQQIPVILPGGFELNLSPGEHNELQKAIIEELLPRYGHGADVLYVGDTADKFLFLNVDKLKELNFFELSHGELPDIVAYSEAKNWLYLIEAVHSFGPISENRSLELKRLTKDCTADIVFITAFLDRAKFRSWIKDIAWETEVWIAETPDHLIHFNGVKFLGSYTTKESS
ncbi:MAG: BsuBI/PstI family type II restriction endonuclease [Ktedonobacteraceae bacterium]